MNKNRKHFGLTTIRHQRIAKILVVVLTVALAAPAFAVCACCDAMSVVIDQNVAEVANDTQENIPSCHASEPVAKTPKSCHEEKPASDQRKHRNTKILSSCQFECVKNISMTGFVTDEIIPPSNSTKIQLPVSVPAVYLPTAHLNDNQHTAYESPPDLSALHTLRYSTVLPPRI